MGHTLDVRVVYIACAPVCAYAHTMFVHVSHSCGDATHTRGRVTRTACYYVRCTPVCARETYSHVAYTPTGTSQPRSPPLSCPQATSGRSRSAPAAAGGAPTGPTAFTDDGAPSRRRDPRLCPDGERLRSYCMYNKSSLLQGSHYRRVCRP
jgi:hypothetical protein